MSRLTEATPGTSAPPVPAPTPQSVEISSTYLAPADRFPSALAELELVELHVLHSRISRQLEREYTDPAGPHPVTLDRAEELAAELDTRQDFLASAGPAASADLPAGAPRAPRGTEAAPRETSGTRPAPEPARHAAAPGEPTSATAPPEQEPRGPLSHTGEEHRNETMTRIHDLVQLRPGEEVQVWHRGQLDCLGTVEEAAPALGVVWIREALDGYRRMIHVQHTELRAHRPDHGAGDSR